MNLDAIPAGAEVLVDANLLIYAVQHASPQCRRLITRCASREVLGFITAVGVAEFCHRRMMQEAQSRGLAASNPAKVLGRDPALVKSLSRYRHEMDDLLASGMSILSLEKSDFFGALELQRQNGLLTSDSLHVAIGLRAGLKLLASSDPHFDTVPDITIFKPDDMS